MSRTKAKVRPETKEERRFISFRKLTFGMAQADAWQVQRAMRHARRLMRGLPLTDEDHECIRLVPDEARRRELTFAAVQKWLTTADGKDYADLGLSNPEHAALRRIFGDAGIIIHALDGLIGECEKDTDEAARELVNQVKRIRAQFRAVHDTALAAAFPPGRSRQQHFGEVMRDWQKQREKPIS